MPSFVVHFSAFFLESMQQCVHGSVCLLHIVTLHVVLLLLYISQSANNKCTAFLISRTRRTRPLPGLRSHPGLIELFITNSLGFLRDNHEGYLLLMTSRQTHNNISGRPFITFGILNNFIWTLETTGMSILQMAFFLKRHIMVDKFPYGRDYDTPSTNIF